jgi:thiosulfate/3-mercaptopyruvate sulfurtransferase
LAGAGEGTLTEIGVDELAARLGEVAIVDVRTAQEFDGTLGEPCDPRQGHIPGARNVEVYDLMQLEPNQIEAALGIDAGGEIVAYCHSGSRSAIATQMLRALGYDARNFVGSWHEWSRHDDLPVER